MKLPRVSTFTYNDKKRVVIERGPNKDGLLCTQIKPEKGYRTFKPAKMMDVRKLGIIRSLWYLFRSIRIEVA